MIKNIRKKMAHCWRGEMPLWKVFWEWMIMHNLLAAFFVINVVPFLTSSFSLSVQDPIQKGFFVLFALWLVTYLPWSMICTLKCGKNTHWRGWQFLSILAILLILPGIAMFLYALFLALPVVVPYVRTV